MLVITDLRMPVMSAHFTAAGFRWPHEFLPKPFDLDALLERVVAHTGRIGSRGDPDMQPALG